MKLRLLNASHQALACPGCLVGYRLVCQAASDPLIAGYLLDYMTREAMPTLQPVPTLYAALSRSVLDRGVRATLADLNTFE